MGILDSIKAMFEPPKTVPPMPTSYQHALEVVRQAIADDDEHAELKPFEIGDMTLTELEESILAEAAEIQEYIRRDYEISNVRAMQFASKVEVYMTMTIEAREAANNGPVS